MCDTQLEKIRDTLDKVPGNFSNLSTKSARCAQDIIPDRIHPGENNPRRRLYLERRVQRDNVFGFRLEIVEIHKDLKFLRFLANFLRDEFACSGPTVDIQ